MSVSMDPDQPSGWSVQSDKIDGGGLDGDTFDGIDLDSPNDGDTFKGIDVDDGDLTGAAEAYKSVDSGRYSGGYGDGKIDFHGVRGLRYGDGKVTLQGRQVGSYQNGEFQVGGGKAHGTYGSNDFRITGKDPVGGGGPPRVWPGDDGQRKVE